MLTDFPLTDLQVHLIGIVVLPLLGYWVGRAHGGVIFQNAIVRLSVRLLTDESYRKEFVSSLARGER